MKKEKVKKITGRKKGIVVSENLNSTISVAVTSFKTHKKYRKKYKSTKKYKVHDSENKHKRGEVVEIIPCRPMSKNKFYKVV